MSAHVTFRMDEVPRFFRLPVAIYGALGAAALDASFRVMGAVARFEQEGRAERDAAGAAIEACWHRDVWAFLMGLSPERPWVSFMHPGASLVPFATFMRWRGGRVVLGSAGNDGRTAAEEITRLLRDGFSLIVFPDGPAGPARKVKPGLLQLARASGRPIVPVRFDFSRPFAVPTWDAKRMPWPGSLVRKNYGKPIWVGEDLQAAAAELEAALG